MADSPIRIRFDNPDRPDMFTEVYVSRETLAALVDGAIHEMRRIEQSSCDRVREIPDKGFNDDAVMQIASQFVENRKFVNRLRKEVNAFDARWRATLGKS